MPCRSKGLCPSTRSKDLYGHGSKDLYVVNRSKDLAVNRSNGLYVNRSKGPCVPIGLKTYWFM